MTVLRFTIPGQPAATNELYKPNGFGGQRKTDVAREYERVIAFVGTRARRKAGWETTKDRVEVSIRIFFRSERSDIDGPEKILLDALQESRAHRHPAHRRVGAGVYVNDRQVKRKLTEVEVDRERPRIEIAVGPIGHVISLSAVLRGQQAGSEG